MSKFKDYFGPWALITGASSGIGEEFARQIAAQGLNLIITARREDRLQKLATELAAKHGIEVRTVGLDLVQSNFMDTLVPAVEGLEIGLLINNAGIEMGGAFYKSPLENHLRVQFLNATAPTILTHHFCRPMIERKKGGIIFTASVSSFFPVPYMGNYAPTKAYILSLADGLNLELGRKGIKVQALCPGYTRTEMSEGVPDSIMMMQPEKVVRKSLHKLIGGYPSVVPGWINILMARVLPTVSSRRFLTRLAARMVS